MRHHILLAHSAMILGFVTGLGAVYFAFYPVKGDDIFQVYVPIYVYCAIWLIPAISWLTFRSSKTVAPLIGVIVICAIALPVWTLLRFDNERLRYNAARYGHRTILKTLLLLHGSKQSELDKALVDSALGNDKEMVSHLLRRGANPSTKLLMSDPVLVLTVQRKSLEITNLLLQAGADVNAYDNDGMTAMMWAAQQDQPEILKVLIAANGDKTLRNTHGETALIIAQRFQHNDIERLLTENPMGP